MDNFVSVGTDKLSIGVRDKMGSTSLRDLLNIFTLGGHYMGLDKNQTTVVLIRDVIDKWKSGYIQELVEYVEGRKLGHPTNPELRQFFGRLKTGYYTTFTNPDDVTKEGLEIMRRVHDYYADLSWMTFGHAEFWSWNNKYYKSLWELSMNPNIYFLNLEELGNPKFLKWLQEKDEDWKQVKEMPHKTQTLEKFWPQMELLWKEYNDGKILKGKILASPFFETKLPDFIEGEEFTYREIDSEIGEIRRLKFDVHLKLLEFHQDSVDYIRNSHERYLKFDI